MNNKILLSIMLGIMLISLCSASLGTFKQNSCVDIKTILNTSSVTLSNLNYPDGTSIVSNKAMSKNAALTWNYTTCATSKIGLYNYDYYDAEGNVYVNDYEVTPSGFQATLGFYFILLIVLGGLIILGFSVKDGWFVVFGGLGLMALGIYSINEGVAGFRDMFIPWMIGLFEIGVGGYLAVNSSIELIENIELN